MGSQQLLDPILEGGIHSTHFFNGRRLTAEDLIREKKANRRHERLLGQAIGDGVVYGLEVGLPSGKATGGKELIIKGGLAVNRKGDALYLPNPVTLTLVPPSNDQHVIDADFKNCTKMASTEYPSNTGVYVLLIRPAGDLSGSAPMSSIPDDGGVIGCGRGELVEGVRFRTVKMELGLIYDLLSDDTEAALKAVTDKTDDAGVSLFRNIVAHACFGTEEKEKYIVDPLGNTSFPTYGALDKLRSLTDAKNEITECDVPLALLRWTDKQIQYADMWSVRRCPGQCAVDQPFSFSTGDRLLVEGKAVFYQFQEHLSAIMAEAASLDDIVAVYYFHHLPPIGYLPVWTDTSGSGLNYSVFFNGFKYREPVFIECAKVGPLLRQGLNGHPVKMEDKGFVWLYSVVEHRRTIEGGKPRSGMEYLIFASGFMPYMANARYNISRWNYSNYGRV